MLRYYIVLSTDNVCPAGSTPPSVDIIRIQCNRAFVLIYRYSIMWYRDDRTFMLFEYIPEWTFAWVKSTHNAEIGTHHRPILVVPFH